MAFVKTLSGTHYAGFECSSVMPNGQDEIGILLLYHLPSCPTVPLFEMASHKSGGKECEKNR